MVHAMSVVAIPDSLAKSMKTPQRIRFRLKPIAARVLLPALVVGTVPVRAADSVRDTKPVVMEPVTINAEKTHTLFMGADISVNLDKDVYPVRDIQGSSWVILINGQEKLVSAKGAPLNLKITPALKLTEASATILGFRRQPSYSFANDPSVLLTRTLSQSALSSAMLLGVAHDAQNLADTVSNKALGPASIFADSDTQFGSNALMFTAQIAYAVLNEPKVLPGQRFPPPNPNVPSTFDGAEGQALATMLNNQNAVAAANQAKNGDEPTGRLVTQGLDAMDVEFEISSPRPLNNPYVVTIARFHPEGTKPGVVQHLVYGKALNPIDSHLSRVRFHEDGFPFNYELLDFQIHIYNKGQEIATNESAKRIELTRDEAFEYIKIEYIAAHKDDTLAAEAALGRLPAELPFRLAQGKYNEPFFTVVSKDGMADEPFLDAACSRKIEDPFLESVVRSLRFKPALSHGKPVEGVAVLNLSKLQI